MMVCGAEAAKPRADDAALISSFNSFIRDRDFPCVGAKAAYSKGQIHVQLARDIRSAWDDLIIHDALYAFAQRYKAAPKLFQSFAVIFRQPTDLTEVEFESSLWSRIQSLTDKDVWRGAAPDPRVDLTADSPHFSLSFGGEAFFAVGLHPGASRTARRFLAPTIVFNLHDQFERLRADGLYEKLRETILGRDEALQGWANPMLSRHGEASEARQYSGRAVEPDWRCPLHRAETATTHALADLLT